MIRISGTEKHEARLKRLSGAYLRRSIEVALADSAEDVAEFARESIRDGAISGKGHIPSRPGEPPSQDTGVLAQNIRTQKVGELHHRVASEADYGGYLELGTSKMAARPYLAPASAAKRREVAGKVAAAIQNLNRDK